jgi:metal-responsive CopG/Arc/MetJ family transcriptional regulator
MASGTVAVRLPDKVLEELQERATKENKKVSDLVRELIVSGLAKTQGKDQGAAGTEVMARLDKLDKRLGQVLEKKEKDEGPPILRTALGLDEMEKRLTTLLIKAVKAGAASQFYARAGTLETVDLVSIWSAQIGAPENTEARKEVAGRLDADGQNFAEWWLKSG